MRAGQNERMYLLHVALAAAAAAAESALCSRNLILAATGDKDMDRSRLHKPDTAAQHKVINSLFLNRVDLIDK